VIACAPVYNTPSEVGPGVALADAVTAECMITVWKRRVPWVRTEMRCFLLGHPPILPSCYNDWRRRELGTCATAWVERIERTRSNLSRCGTSASRFSRDMVRKRVM